MVRSSPFPFSFPLLPHEEAWANWALACTCRILHMRPFC